MPQLKSFTEYLAESAPSRVVAFTFARFQPPTSKHEKLLNAVASIAELNKCQYRIYTSRTQDNKKNPLSHADKIKFLRDMFPKHARAIVSDTDADSILNAASILYTQSYTDVYCIVGEDRVIEFQALLDRYNNEKSTSHGFYNFRSIVVQSSGESDPDSDCATSMSASKMRAAASSNDLNTFSSGLPRGYGDSEKLFNAVRVGLGLKESTNFRKHIQLDSVGERREQYINGDLFADGDSVVIKESQEVGVIRHLGSNYVVVELAEGVRVRKWLDAVELIEEKKHIHDDSLPFAIAAAKQYAPIKRESLSHHIAKPLSVLRSNKK